nr:MAG TPA: hypothetical protein [Caudoviricetes sp.]
MLRLVLSVFVIYQLTILLRLVKTVLECVEVCFVLY